MKALTTFIAIALLAFSTTACSQQHTYRSGGFGSKTVKASKNYVTKDIKVDNFTKLSVAGSPDVTYTQKSGKPTVEVYTSDNIVDLLDIRVKDNTLYIGFKKNVSVSYNKLEVRVSAEKLNGIAVAGSGDVELKNGLRRMTSKSLWLVRVTSVETTSPAQTSIFPSQARETSIAATSLAMTSKYPLQVQVT